MNAKETVLESKEDFGNLLVENGKALLVEVSSFLWIQRTAGLIEKRIELLVAVAGSVVIPRLELYGFFVAHELHRDFVRVDRVIASSRTHVEVASATPGTVSTGLQGFHNYVEAGFLELRDDKG